jgi:beta-mannosidase
VSSPRHVGSWEVATTAGGQFHEVPREAEVPWRAVQLPFYGSDDDDHWFRTQIRVDGPAPTLVFKGLATICDLFVDGKPAARSESMFLECRLPMAPGTHEVAVCARALTPVLALPRRPRARWRTRVVPNGNLRWVRTSFLGRAPMFGLRPPLVGPWRPVEVWREPPGTIDVRARLQGGDGSIEIRAPADAGKLEITLASKTTPLPPGGGTVRISRPELWWPHTHGDPHLYPVHIRTDAHTIVRKVGFRQLSWSSDTDADGLELGVNGTRIFVRGAVWTPPPRDEIRSTLERAREAGMNMVRIPGTTCYERPEFHDACDDLGILLWQDLMFANLDYPFADDAFEALAVAEVDQVLAEVASRPSLAVVCGSSEVEQQVAMLGLPPELADGHFFSNVVPERLRACEIDAPYIRSAPSGGTFPFRTNRGVASYFGVGAYRRPVEDVRRAEVRFASECLAFANVPNENPTGRSVGVMRDPGAAWDFADVRDHYLVARDGISPSDADYWERSRFVTGELMAEVFGEWRRAASPSNGGLVLWLRDLAPGSGWGVLERNGTPKVAWYQLRRALAPVAVWMVDEGLNGIGVHVANDTSDLVRARLRVAIYQDEEIVVGTGQEALELQPHETIQRDFEEILGGFADVNYVYRFGEPQHDVVVATLEHEGRVLSQAFRYPAGRPSSRQSAEALGLAARATVDEHGNVELTVESGRLVRGVRLFMPAFAAEENAFDLEPGHSRTIRLTPLHPGARGEPLALEALNLVGRTQVRVSWPR